MREWKFTPLWDQTEGQWLGPHIWEGTSPIDALLKHWATCLPDTPLSSPLRGEDGHVYHLRLDHRGNREITIVAQPVQFVVNTLR